MTYSPDTQLFSSAMAAKPRKQSRAIATRQKILVGASRVFDASGYTAASINDVVASTNLTKGALFYHFASKEAIAQVLVRGWSAAVHAVFADASETGEPPLIQLRNVFMNLARLVDSDLQLRAGMKLALEPGIEGAHPVYWWWVDTTSALVDENIGAEAVPSDPRRYRLAWNLCAGFIGAVQGGAVLREEVDLPTRVEDMISAHLEFVHFGTDSADPRV
ncbi:TetR/AcrR family transcriptional regulator [Rhodococcus qingshengii]|uniref:TetR/AcrR family transcriptional regulator n=1 Tax=Rhodococcus qingshengii TaxID=334542 RepID=A0AAW6LNT4_RHOSG|nr:TetR/AcrR family transcriptional regulator [Rhodococcus qingshengii]MDE8647473.1 TetR/AcrR family transcriptional regulator [Rhodococcus qingshengii]